MYVLLFSVTSHTMALENIINMDETPCYFDMVGGSTFDVRGSKDVLQQSSGHDKMR